MILTTNITCPRCGFVKQETMPEQACVAFYRCPECETQVKAKEGECCVYCSYGDYPCPTAQIIASACCSPD